MSSNKPIRPENGLQGLFVRNAFLSNLRVKPSPRIEGLFVIAPLAWRKIVPLTESISSANPAKGRDENLSTSNPSEPASLPTMSPVPQTNSAVIDSINETAKNLSNQGQPVQVGSPSIDPLHALLLVFGIPPSIFRIRLKFRHNTAEFKLALTHLLINNNRFIVSRDEMLGCLNGIGIEPLPFHGTPFSIARLFIDLYDVSLIRMGQADICVWLSENVLLVRRGRGKQLSTSYFHKLFRPSQKEKLPTPGNSDYISITELLRQFPPL